MPSRIEYFADKGKIAETTMADNRPVCQRVRRQPGGPVRQSCATIRSVDGDPIKGYH
ncbi:MAG: hypothetical protein R6V51_02620 [Dehalococcoidia bacterium]